MLLAPTLITLLVVLSFSSVPTAANLFRVPLERKSLITRIPHLGNASHYVSVDILKLHVALIATKYRSTLAAYQENTGVPHPLAQAISGILLHDPEGSGVEIALPPLEQCRRKRDTTPGVELRNQIPSSRTPQGRHTKRDDISLSEVNSNMWMGIISVGTPPKNFTVDFDTGSADLILPAQACDNSCDGHTRYDSTTSSTSASLNKTFEIRYSGGSNVNGSQYADNVYMDNYEAMNQTFGAATTYSSGLESPGFIPDGLLGMGFPSISILPASTVFQTMVSTDAVQQAVFAFALSSEPGKSELTVGGTNTNMYQQSTVEYVNVSLPAYWQIPLAGLTRPGLNNTPDVVVVNKTSYAQSIIDTGTTLIITSDSNAEAFYADVPGAMEIGGGLWSVPCDIIDSLAPTLTYGSSSFSVSPSTFNFGPVSEGSTNCTAGLAGGGSPWWIIGDVFLQNVYTIFDVANTRVGFADLA